MGEAGGKRQGERFTGEEGREEQGGSCTGEAGFRVRDKKAFMEAGGQVGGVKRMKGGAYGAERAELEAHVAGLACLVHPNVLGLVACLQAALQPGATPLSLQQRVDITVGVLLALKAVQSHGQVHGDLKPSNVLLSPAFEARVVDWSVVCMGQRVHVDMGSNGLDGQRKGSGKKGLARIVSLPSGDRGTSSSSGRRGGKSGYSWGSGRSGSSISSTDGGEQKVYLLRCTEGHMDPAVVQTGIATPTSDMYSVGVLLLQLLTGWAGPFRDVDGQRTHIYDWARQHADSDDISPLLDPLLPHPLPPPATLLPLFRLALACSSPSLSARPTPVYALDVVRTFRTSLLEELLSGRGVGGETGEKGKVEGGEKGGKGEGEGGGRRDDGGENEGEGRGKSGEEWSGVSIGESPEVAVEQSDDYTRLPLVGAAEDNGESMV
ncbi:unnamed protein product [Closterium sp. Yama58-4]|nr:unnamed protein product [Closterium sp. Yama58-4]